MKDNSLSTKSMLLNIGSMRKRAFCLIGKGHLYDDLLKVILAQDFYNDENIPLPSLKDLSKVSGIRYEKVRKLIDAIYNDLVMNDETRPTFSFTNVRYEFYITGWRKNKSLFIDVDRLPVMPRVGEEISIPFFSAYLGTSQFFVERVIYNLEEDIQVIQIWVKAGFYNSYWHYRKDKAKEENELPLFDFLDLEEYQLKEKLKVRKY